MARGPSGKLVIEVDPSLKDALHARLAIEKKTMKAWFIKHAEDYVGASLSQSVPYMKVAESSPATFRSERSQ